LVKTIPVGLTVDCRPKRRSGKLFDSLAHPKNRSWLLKYAHHLKIWAQKLTLDGHAVYLASRDPRVPWHVKLLAVAVAGYALSPIDLIPDFIPVVGYLDDLIILPLGIWLVVALIPDDVMAECRSQAAAAQNRPVSRAGMIAIIGVWIAMGLMMGWIGYFYWNRPGEPRPG
jgi:uncharacterized membrane protein YkvA (DUF1232 family)